jgi:FAD/FMN-containing dehydrogenase
VVSPASVPELSAVLAWCNDNGCPVIPEGGRTNLNQGTAASPEAIILSTARLDQIGTPDPQAMTVEAGAGAVIQTLQERCEAQGLRFGLDFGARGSAMLGGALSTNAGGFQALRYGVARDQVLGLEAVLADGTVLSHLTAYAKDNTGYDLKQLFIGSEGTLGVITRAVLRLHPGPVTRSTALLGFRDFEAVTRTLATMRRNLQGTLSSYEIMWEEFYEFNLAALSEGRRPMQDRFPFCVLCEAEGFAPESDDERFQNAVMQAIDSGDAGDAVIAQSLRQRDELWRIREDFDAEQRLFTVMIDFDISLRLRDMAAFVAEAERSLAREIPEFLGLHVLGHLGDGNLHVTTGLPTPERKDEVKALIYALIARYGGSISAEHGIGINKRDYLHHSRSAAEIATMRRLKMALDPRNILNPGKVLP